MDKNLVRSSILSFCLILSSAVVFGQNPWTLEQCISRGLDQNLDIQSAQLNETLNSITLEQSKWSRLPNLNAGATHGYNWGQTIDPFTNQFATDRVRNNNFFLQSQVVLFNGFQINNGIKQSKIELEASELDVRQAQNDISLAIAQAYLNLLFAKEQANTIVAQVNISQRQVERMQRLVEVGQEAVNSLYDVESQLAADQLTMTQAENNVAISKIMLANLMLLSPEESDGFDIQAPAMDMDQRNEELPPLAAVYEQALSSLPQIRAAELRTASSETGLDVARGARSPQLALQGSIGSGYSGANLVPEGDPVTELVPIGITEDSGERVFTQSSSYTNFETKDFSEQLDDNFNQSLSLSLTIPIFNGYSTTSDISRAKIAYQQSKLNEQGTRNLLLQNVQQAHADAAAAKKSYESAQLALKAMALNYENSEKRFEQEMISTVDFNDAKSRLAQSEIDALRAKYDYIFRLTIIDFYMGKPLSIN